MEGIEEKIEVKEEKLIEERKKKFKAFVTKSSLWVVVILIIALILGIYIRSLPMKVRPETGKPGLWDITTNNYTLGPDLDPFLFLRYAEVMINQGHLPKIDVLRNVPLGFDISTELQMVSYMIVLTYKIINIFGNYNINFAGIIMPVIFFALTILVFFLFVREVFVKKGSEDKNFRANAIALISTFFMIVIPVFLSRTIAGIPEKESVGFFFMFLSFYLFLKAWKSENTKIALILGILSGISTALMGLTWGGVIYVYITIAVASFIAFILNKVGKKEVIIYSAWIFVSIIITQIFSNRVILKDHLTSLDSGLAFFIFLIFIVHLAITHTKLSKLSNKINLPKNITSLVFALILAAVLVSILFGPLFIVNKLKDINNILFNPVTGRWKTTVAENRQPYFVEWGANFGPFIKNIPVMFWLFFAGSIVLFKEMLNKIKKKDAWILTALYILFFFGLVFSRYAPNNILNGDNFISKAFYYVSALLLIGSLIYYYIKYQREGQEGFEKIEYNYLLLFSLFVLCLVTARSAVRLIMVLGPIAPIFVSYLIVKSISWFRKTDDETLKVIFGGFAILILVLSLFTFWTFYKGVNSQAYNNIPSIYTQQWQKAMAWVRENTAENAVFAHWWDYGYWVQSIGKRATVTDGGNAIVYWNYLTGRDVLTTDKQENALGFLYSHNATHLLIDSSDLGKYGAFSIIGSNENYDRFSPGPPSMVSDSKQIQETKEGILRIYQGGTYIDEDIIYDNNGTRIFLPSGKAAIIGIFLEIIQKNNSTSFKQPEAVFYNEGIQIKIPLRYLYYNGELSDYLTGLNATAYVTQRVIQGEQGIQLDNLGVAMYLSPRLMRGMLAQVYILNDPFNKFPNFKLVHSEPNIIIGRLNEQGAKLNEFVYFGEMFGPIKIWKINYKGNEKINPDYLLTQPPESITWKF